MPKALAKKGPGGAITARQARLARMLGDPGQADLTQVEMAKELGVGVTTIKRWKALPEVQEAVNKHLDKYLTAMKPDALRALHKEIKKGDIAAIRLFFNLLGENVQRHEHSGPGGGPVRLAVLAAYSDQELEQLDAKLQE